ncbi:copper chaperone PCu(A)C [Psychromonas sp. SP041]|uniref:copper chaperone PCu(A)C n=1 Tax=Psychromonas sp. SP041 TaxID=1365007 RepID=UPI000401BF27|nr:copper chaperone PCu(A)C [Psychromonas sp. SP041]
MKRLILLICTLLLSINSFASELDISEQHIRATPPHAKNSAAFFTITNNTNKNVNLVAVQSDIAEQIQIHTNINEDGLMKMRQVDTIMIKANSSTSLQPGGYHVMFLGLKNDLIEGQSIKLTLYFDNGEQIKVNTPVQRINASHEMSGKKHH